MLNYLQEKLIFKSEQLPKNHKFNFNIRFKEVFLKAKDGAKLHGVHFQQDDSKGIILYFHGNARNIDYWGIWGEQLSSTYKYDVVLMDYRGYGKSKGERSYTQMLEDSLVFYNYCCQFFTEDKIILFGRSLGGAFASYTSLHTKSEKLILESTFTTLEEVAKTKFWFLPTSLLLKYPFQNERNMPLINSETFIIHGSDDPLVKYELAQKLYHLSNSKSKELKAIEGAVHNDLRNFEGYHKYLDQIL
ncbi:alpha/beta hydrolase [Zhouia amylolytica]|uniref:alpha/beta hydrolase n=1 Tax=Zhouia amylolytica TaxID=376730 RepID=UPI0020CFE40E|nr:alpha/beta fold hydrolase [Zhouia amylolytica]MCQ0112702.1 alpha/beta fold hydrolase [Zhouia amylolytica]